MNTTSGSVTAGLAPGGRSPAPGEQLLGIGAAAARVGVSERALRYYQQRGLIVPRSTTPGGLRRYSAENLARVARIRELQTVLGLNLDEIAIVLGNEDRLAQIRRAYEDRRTSEGERLRLASECLTLLESLRTTVEGKRAALESFLADLDARIGRAKDVLAGRDTPPHVPPPAGRLPRAVTGRIPGFPGHRCAAASFRPAAGRRSGASSRLIQRSSTPSLTQEVISA